MKTRLITKKYACVSFILCQTIFACSQYNNQMNPSRMVMQPGTSASEVVVGNDFSIDMLNSLGRAQNFKIFDLCLTEDQSKSLDKLNINPASTPLFRLFRSCFTPVMQKEYNNFGKLNNLKEEVKTFILSLDNDEKVSDCVSEIIEKLTQQVIQVYHKQTAWVAVRAFAGSLVYDTPRWHMDGPYYASYGEQSKVVTTLKGAGTLLYNLPYESRSQEIKDLLESATKNKADRVKLSQRIDQSKIVSLEAGKGAVFLTGVEYAAIHSEPQINEDRLFLFILPGNVDEIEELRQNWNVK